MYSVEGGEGGIKGGGGRGERAWRGWGYKQGVGLGVRGGMLLHALYRCARTTLLA